DMLPTFAKLTGTQPPQDRVIDGRDITSLMMQPGAPPVRDTHLYFTGAAGLGAIRQGDWKLFLISPTGAKGKKTGQPKALKPDKKSDAAPAPALVDLAKDPAEPTDVSAQHPDIVARLRAEAEKREKEIKEHQRPAGEIK